MLSTIETEKLTTEQQHFLCFAINHFGTGQHPVATLEHLRYFMAEGTKDAVSKAVASGTISKQAKLLAIEVLEVL